MRTSVALLSLLTILSSPSHTQQPLRTTTAGVLVDVVVLDRDGRPIVDLGLDEFELSEAGAKQAILSATLVQGGITRPVGSRPDARAAADPSGRVAADPAAAAERSGQRATASITAVLFDRLSPEVRPLARRAALAFISTLTADHDYAGVFLADATMRTFGPFTNRADALREAVDRSMSVATGKPASGHSETSPITRGLSVEPSQPVTPGSEWNSGWVNAAEREKALNAAGAEGILRRMELRMTEGYQQLLTEYDGKTSVAGLRAVVEALAPMPGRKSVMYFTESLSMTDRVKPAFDAVIALANRHNITFYPVDAAGLRVDSTEGAVSRGVSVAGAQGIGDAKREDGGWTKELERQDQLLASRPTAVLGRLAKETGGFVLASTNNLAAGVSRMVQERSTYYLLAYQPSHPALDGSFRRIEIKVKRPRVTVRARPGYRAAAQP